MVYGSDTVVAICIYCFRFQWWRFDDVLVNAIFFKPVATSSTYHRSLISRFSTLESEGTLELNRSIDNLPEVFLFTSGLETNTYSLYE
jgi:hypothetical protein